MLTRTEFDYSKIDLVAIERRAHELRAQAMKDGVRAIATALRSICATRRDTPVHHA